MTRSIRAYRAAARCDDLAESCAAADLTTDAQQLRRNAAAWRRIAAEESAKERAAVRRCYCGRKVSSLPDSDGINCAEHDGPHAVLVAV